VGVAAKFILNTLGGLIRLLIPALVGERRTSGDALDSLSPIRSRRS
jgi:hypothetical protein